MKRIVAALCAVLVFALSACAQPAASTASRPDNTAGRASANGSAPSGDVNTFGDSRDPPADEAQRARTQSLGADPSDHQANSGQQANAPAPR